MPGCKAERHAVVFTVLLAATLLPSSSAAQGLAYVIPSISFAIMADSNVFSTPSSGASDIVRRTAPGVRAGYRTALWALAGGYTFDADQYQQHPEVNNRLARQRSDVDLRFAGRRSTFSATSSYLMSDTPQEININTGLALLRAPATLLTADSLFGHQLNSVTRALVVLQLESNSLKPRGGSSVSARSTLMGNLRVGLERRLSSTDTVSVHYQERAYAFDGIATLPGPASTASRTALVGWTRTLSPLTRTSLLAGPRLSDGKPYVEFEFDIRRRLQIGAVSFGVTNSESSSLGEGSPVELTRVIGSLTVRPARRLDIEVQPSLRRSSAHRSDLRATVVDISVVATGLVNRWLSIESSYSGTRQRGDDQPFGSMRFARDVIAIRAIAKMPGSANTAVPEKSLR